MRHFTKIPSVFVLALTLASKASVSAEFAQSTATEESYPVIVFDKGHHNYGIDELIQTPRFFMYLAVFERPTPEPTGSDHL